MHASRQCRMRVSRASRATSENSSATRAKKKKKRKKKKKKKKNLNSDTPCSEMYKLPSIAHHANLICMHLCACAGMQAVR